MTTKWLSKTNEPRSRREKEKDTYSWNFRFCLCARLKKKRGNSIKKERIGRRNLLVFFSQCTEELKVGPASTLPSFFSFPWASHLHGDGSIPSSGFSVCDVVEYQLPREKTRRLLYLNKIFTFFPLTVCN